MRRSTLWTCLLLFFLSPALRSQNAPITTVGSVLNAVAGSVTVPVTVRNFVNIGTISLTLDYNVSSLAFVSAIPNASLAGNFSVNSSTPGRLILSWFGTGLTFPDNTHLADLTFTFTTGTSALTFFDNGNSCQYTDGANNILNDTPYTTYYINGVITNLAAPVTYAPTVTNASAGPVNVPVTVERFNNIGSVSLTLEYDQWVLTYVNITPNPALSGGTLNTSTAQVGSKYRLTISWYGTGVTLGDGSTLFTIGFNFTTANGRTFSELKWIDTGGSCQYADGSTNVLYDSPTADFYKNGVVAGQVAPKTYLPTITNASPGSITIPVTVDNFTSSIGAIALRFEYDPAVISYSTFSKNPALSGAMYVGDAIGTGGKHQISIAWFGTSPGLSNGSYIVNLSFTYISGISRLKFLDDGSSCEYGDLLFLPLYDKPQPSFYVDGAVSPGVAPVTIAATIGAAPGNPVTVPVTANGFSNIGTMSLTLDYDPGVLTYVSTTPNAGFPGLPLSFAVNSSTPGRLTFSWFGTGTTFTNGTQILGVTFTYLGGTSPLDWYDNGNSCQYSDGALNLLYDLPQSTYYINGQVFNLPAPVADFSANTVLPLVNETVTFTDLSTGGAPATWAWSFSPATVTYAGGTSAASQNPQVQFTVNGVYSASLTVTNTTGTSTMTKTDYLHVGTPGLWTGITSEVWYRESNWHNYMIPDASVDVVIPTTKCPTCFWPNHAGNFSLGSRCRSLTMDGNAQMIVEGTMFINPGSRLEFTGNGRLQVSVDWYNSGTFFCGTGTVEFIGGVESQIIGALHPRNFVSNLVRTTFPGAMTNITSGTAGPSGDNAHADVPIGFAFNYLGIDYTTLRINTNGWISMDLTGDDGTSSDNTVLFTGPTPNTTLAPWWDNLSADGSSAITYKTTGSEPDRVFTAEWKDVLAYSTGATTRLSFQVLLHESSNVIEFVYGTPAAGSHNAGESASAGVNAEAAGPEWFIDATTGSMTVGVTTLKSGTDWPLVNYRFTPPPKDNTFYNLTVTKSGAKLTNPAGNNVNVNGNLTVNP
jgi:PKD repeat protein